MRERQIVMIMINFFLKLKIVTKASAKHLFFSFTLDLVSPSSLQWKIMKVWSIGKTKLN